MVRPLQLIFAIVTAIVWLTAERASHAQDVLKPGDVISGRLRLVKTHHPNGTPINAYQIVVDTPRMFAEKDEFCGDAPPRAFHLSVMDDNAKESRLKKLIGQKVAVIGEDFFCSMTAWHIGDAVVIKWRFVEPARH